MKIFKKTIFGLGLIIIAVLAFITFSEKVLAFSPTQLKDATYTIVSKGSITMVIGGKTYNFTDRNTTDTVWNWKPDASSAVGAPCMANTNDGPGDGINYTIDLINPPGAKGGTAVNIGEVVGVGPRGPVCSNLASASGIVLLNPNKIAFGDATNTGGTTTSDSSGCVANSHTSLEWLFCPIITAISKATDGINTLVINQLDFKVNQNLGEKPPNDGVKTAWTSVKNIATALIVVVMLIVVFSQAFGNGVLDAYTVKKMLPKVVIAVIAMQLSWYLCKYLIGLSNDLGNGIAQIMAAPFGGAGELDLGSLLNRLSGWWAVGTELTLAGVLVASVTLASAFLPGIALIAFTLFLSVMVALATLLFRNALIIALVIFSPIAIILWVMPGTQRYWKMWSDNFIKLLLLFPIMVAVIYAGRIFAWIAGGLGTPGFLDFMMVLVGFFAPYFIIFKAFKWGGSALAASSRAISENAATRRARETGVKEIGAWQQRRQNLNYAKPYNPEGPKLGVERDASGKIRRKFGIIPVLNGKLPQSIMAGRYVPTKRAEAVMMQRGNEESQKEDAVAAARVNRVAELAEKQGGIVGYRLDKNGSPDIKEYQPGVRGGTGALKTAYVNFMGGGKSEERVAGQGVEKFIGSSSFPELGSSLVPIKDVELLAEMQARGAELYLPDDVADDVKAQMSKDGALALGRPFELPIWSKKIDTGENLYGAVQGKFPQGSPHIQEADYRAKYSIMEKNEAGEPVLDNNREPVYSYVPSLQSARALETMQGYISAGNGANLAESQYSEIGRAAQRDPHVATAFAGLMERFAASGQAGYNTLGHLKSGESSEQTVNGILKLAPGALDLDGYIAKAQLSVQQGRGANVNIPPPEATPDPAPRPPTQQPGGQTIISPTGVQASEQGVPGSGQNGEDQSVLFVRPQGDASTADSGAAEAMRQAAEAMTEASQQIRRSAVAQAQTARRLGPIIDKATSPDEGSNPAQQQRAEGQDEEDKDN